MNFKNLIKNIFSVKSNYPVEIYQSKLSQKVYTRKMKLTFNPALKGSKELHRDVFKTKLTVPAMKIKKFDLIKVRRLLKSYSFDTIVSPKRFTNLDPADSLFNTHKYIYLDPDTFNFETLVPNIKEELLNIFKGDESKNNLENFVEIKELDLEYSDFKFEDIIKAIVPDDLLKENVNIKGYSVIGHIAHFNLREKILDYKFLIGEVLLDKISNIKTVVNKLSGIDNTYRNFELEILAGTNDTMVLCKENNCFFRFDFAKVYWNPRLSTEHEIIVKMLESKDVLYDVFAGVGPFSIPAVSNKKLEAVLANDLNPNSFRFLLDNFTNNNKSKAKKKGQDIRKAFVRQHPPEKPILESLFNFSPSQEFLSFNLDGRLFIQDKLKYHFIGMLNYLVKYKPENVKTMKFYVLMNLPAMSVEFLDAFKNLYDTEESNKIKSHFDADILENVGLHIYCYHFSKTSENELEKIQERIKKEIMKDHSLDVNSRHVRNVAPNKEMHVTMFKVNFKNMFTSESNDSQNLENTNSIQNIEIDNIKKKLNAIETDGEKAPKIAKYENSGLY